MTAFEKREELKAELARDGYTYDKTVEHPNGLAEVYQPSGLGSPKQIVIACDENDISLEDA